MNAQLHAIAESISANTFSFMQNWAKHPLESVAYYRYFHELRQSL